MPLPKNSGLIGSKMFVVSILSQAYWTADAFNPAAAKAAR
jgi:hypothetical protein